MKKTAAFRSLQALDLTWLTGRVNAKRIALLIPLYNEASSANFQERLIYFEKFAACHADIEVILINDGSTDSSLAELIAYLASCNSRLTAASVYPNAQKVGALHLVASQISHHHVILSDFDTDLLDVAHLKETLPALEALPETMGCYFKMIPYEGSGAVFSFQQLEYAFARYYYQFHLKDQSVPVMPGAGSCYKREALLRIYQEHSGYRNGEDREATVIGLKLGMKAVYEKRTLALTRPPLSMKKLLIQRKRWYLGYIETVFFQRSFYREQMTARTAIGLRTLQDIVSVILLVSIPLDVLVATILLKGGVLYLIGLSYLISIGYYSYLYIDLKDERKGLHMKAGYLVPLYPAFWLMVTFISWYNALISFFWTPAKQPQERPEPRVSASV